MRKRSPNQSIWNSTAETHVKLKEIIYGWHSSLCSDNFLQVLIALAKIVHDCSVGKLTRTKKFGNAMKII